MISNLPGILIAVFALVVANPASTQAKPLDRDDWQTKVHIVRPLSVLLVGNSHLLMPGFLKRVRRRISAKTDRVASYRTVAKIGTTLSKSRRRSVTKRILRSEKWDVIVLQESTTAFLTPHGRRRFMSAVEWFDQHKPAHARLLLWETWPQGRRHALYHRRGVWGRWFKNPPRNPKHLFSLIKEDTTSVAEAIDANIAPIGRCWMRLARAKRPYAKDNYHASRKGLTFVAEILARSVVATAQTSSLPGRVRGSCP